MANTHTRSTAARYADKIASLRRQIKQAIADDALVEDVTIIYRELKHTREALENFIRQKPTHLTH